jgi:hypothetical protein
MESKLITPLIKRSKAGELYERPPEVTAALERLALVSRDELLRRAAIKDRSNPDFVSSECLLHHIRASRRDNSDGWFQRLYKVLLERLWRSLPRAEGTNGTIDHVKENIRNSVFDRFAEMLLEDKQTPGDKLDFFEIRFDMAVKRMRLDAQDQAWRDERRTASLEEDGVGDQAAVAEFRADQLAGDIFSDPLFRDRLYEAIDTLPLEQSRTMHLSLLGWPTESNDPEVMTIAKALGCSDRSVRTYRARAVKTLVALFQIGDQ